MTKKVICPDPPGDLAQSVVRDAQRLGSKIQRFEIELVARICERIARLFEGIDVARPRGERTFAGIVALGQPAQCAVQFDQALA